MARVTVRISNADIQRIQAEVSAIPARITEASREAVKESGEAIREEVERNVRRDTGRLAERVRVRVVGNLGLTADAGWFDADTYYAQYQEFGTSTIAADPVLTVAGERERRRFPRRLAEHIEEIL